MNLYEQWLQKADDIGLSIVESVPFESQAKGLICGNCIGLNKNLETTAEKVCVLAEEFGHHCTTVGNILTQDDVHNRKQEQQARLWAYNKLIGLNGIINSYKHGCHNLIEMADYLDVTQEFLSEAISKYHSKYGIFTTIDNYVI